MHASLKKRKRKKERERERQTERRDIVQNTYMCEVKRGKNDEMLCIDIKV